MVKFGALVLALLVAFIAAFLLYQRYSSIERSVREAEMAARHQDVLAGPPVQAEP